MCHPNCENELGRTLATQQELTGGHLGTTLPEQSEHPGDTFWGVKFNSNLDHHHLPEIPLHLLWTHKCGKQVLKRIIDQILHAHGAWIFPGYCQLLGILTWHLMNLYLIDVHSKIYNRYSGYFWSSTFRIFFNFISFVFYYMYKFSIFWIITLTLSSL